MRFIQEIAHPAYRIGVYGWNQKYIVKIEAGFYEQTYKVAETDVLGIEAVYQLLDASFLSGVSERFRQMDSDWQQALERAESANQ